MSAVALAFGDYSLLTTEYDDEQFQASICNMHSNIIRLISVASAVAASAIPTPYFSEEARLINKKGTPIYDQEYRAARLSKMYGEDWREKAIPKLVLGLYLSNQPLVTCMLDAWYRLIQADAKKLEDVPKVLIPGRLHNSGEKALKEFVQDQDGNFEFERTLRFAERSQLPPGWTDPFKGPGNICEMLIPPAMVHHNELGLKAYCYDSVDKLPVSDVISYEFHNMQRPSK
ncbi:Uu.00g104400.m01.CDS01 [Anthostomella pinea]|uniref:Uu.00g104400.m01.CDS01 n=1 Tax=Anthostomella pinea TaxID=933095 RepID=A0AAI8VDS5_9PEZI|nr:Uu.00g104400.m01.CDS01 [Anthostomella pinea]